MSLESPYEGLYFRTVRMKVLDWDRFKEGFDWGIQQILSRVKGCHAITYYRSSEEPSLACIVEYWESPSLMNEAYAELGDVGFAMWDRAGNPEYIEDVIWAPASAPPTDMEEVIAGREARVKEAQRRLSLQEESGGVP